MGSPTLMFCIGATKAGTSWLHRFIADHPQCHMRAIKELHYFDSAAFGDWDTWAKDVAARRDRAREDLNHSVPKIAANKTRLARDADAWCRVLQARRADDAAYLEYLHGGRTDERLVGDFTPAYGLLPERTLHHMAQLLPDVRFVYLLRDPVARIWSHVRMMAQRQSERVEDIPQRAIRLMNNILKGMEPQIVRRSDYIGPVSRLRSATEPGQVFFGFFEELFSQRMIAKLCDFLKIDARPADFDRRVMEGPKATMAPGQWNEMRDFLAPQYDAMRAMFGRLPDAWGVEPLKV